MEIEKVRYQIEAEVQRRVKEELRGREFSKTMLWFFSTLIGVLLGCLIGMTRY